MTSGVFKSKVGGARPGSGRKKTPSTQLREAIDNIDVPRCLANLKHAAEGKIITCPYCGANTGMRTADTVALQANIELINRVLGKPVQRQQIDITETIELTGPQVARLIEKYRLALDADTIEGEVLELTEGATKDTDIPVIPVKELTPRQIAERAKEVLDVQE